MSQWADICNEADILPNMGRCALFEGKQVAIFKVKAKDEQFYAIENYCPFAEANVLSRGLVGSVGDKTTIVDPSPKAINTNDLYGYVNMATRERRMVSCLNPCMNLARLPKLFVNGALSMAF